MYHRETLATAYKMVFMLNPQILFMLVQQKLLSWQLVLWHRWALNTFSTLCGHLSKNQGGLLLCGGHLMGTIKCYT